MSFGLKFGCLALAAIVCGNPGVSLTPGAAVGSDFTISVLSSPVSTSPGHVAEATIAMPPSGGFASPVSYAVDGLPPGVTASVGKSSLTAPEGVTYTGLFLSSTTSAPLGTYPLTVTGTGGGVSRSTGLALVIASADFSLSVTPASVTLAPGGRATASVTATLVSGFDLPIAYTATGLPTGATASFTPAEEVGGDVAFTDLLVVTTPATSPGSYTVTLSGRGGGLTRSTDLLLTVTNANFSISVNTRSVRVQPGETATLAVATIVSGGFGSPITLSVEGLPPGASASFVRTTIPAPYDTVIHTLSIATAASVSPATYPLAVTGTGGGLTRTAPLTLVVSEPLPVEFTLSVDPVALSVTRSETVAASVTVSAAGPSAKAVTFTVLGLPDGVTSSVSPVPVPAPPGTIYYEWALAATATAPLGTYAVTFRAESGPTTKSVPVVLTVTAGLSSSRLLPVLLDTEGVGGARYGTELTLANRGTKDATVKLTYTAAETLQAAGSGTVETSLGAGLQAVIPDAIAWLRGKGLAIPSGGSQGGTLRVGFEGLSSPDVSFAGARTTTPSGTGRAGLSYPAVPVGDCFTGSAWVFGLRENAADRSNLALVNASPTDFVTLQVTVFRGDAAGLVRLPELHVLGPGQWKQIGRILGAPLDWQNGYVQVESVSGTAPFFAYGVFNDNATNDGSYVPPVSGDFVASAVTLPVLVESALYSSELVLTNLADAPAVATLTYVESFTPEAGAGGTVTQTLGPGEQWIVPDAIEHLRTKGAAIGPRGSAAFAGALSVRFESGGAASRGFAGARTASPAPEGGQYGVFYPATPGADTATTEAWVYALQQNGSVRSNLAVVNVGNGRTPASFRYEIFDGTTGRLAGTSDLFTVGPGGWVQYEVGRVMAQWGVASGYARVVRVSGGDSFIAYGVVNDGATNVSGATNDGSFVAFSNR